MTIFIIFAGTAVEKVVIKEEPLTWQHVENADGDMLFNNLCATCHGAGAKGDGPAASALDKGVPDLTALAANKDGIYPYGKVKTSISGGIGLLNTEQSICLCANSSSCSAEKLLTDEFKPSLRKPGLN